MTTPIGELWPTPFACRATQANSDKPNPTPTLHGIIGRDHWTMPAVGEPWRTPLASDGKGGHSLEHPHLSGDGFPNLQLREQCATWAMPTIGEPWPTPTKTDGKDAARHTTTTGIMHPGTMMLDAVRQFSLPDPTIPPDAAAPSPASTDAATPRSTDAGLKPGTRGSPEIQVVNPVFVERIMGAPEGWSIADVETRPSATRSASTKRRAPSSGS